MQFFDRIVFATVLVVLVALEISIGVLRDMHPTWRSLALFPDFDLESRCDTEATNWASIFYRRLWTFMNALGLC